MREEIQIKYDFPRTRERLLQMLSELSDDALKYVCRPIWYAYLWTDEHDIDAMTEDDVLRFHLISCAAHDTPTTVKKFCHFHYYCDEEAQS